MTLDQTTPRALVCDDVPATGIETMAEVHARLRTRRQVGEPCWDAREIARSALGELPDRARAEFLTDLLCEMHGGTARQLLCEARNRITVHLHALIAAEYDAETAGLPPGTAAALARPSQLFFSTDDALALRAGKIPVDRTEQALQCVSDGDIVRSPHSGDLQCDHNPERIPVVLFGEKSDG